MSVCPCAASLRVVFRVGNVLDLNAASLRSLGFGCLWIGCKSVTTVPPRPNFLRASTILQIACVTNQLLLQKYLWHYAMLISLTVVWRKEKLLFMLLGFPCSSCKCVPPCCLHLPYQRGGMGTPPALFCSVITVCHQLSQRKRTWALRKEKGRGLVLDISNVIKRGVDSSFPLKHLCSDVKYVRECI